MTPDILARTNTEAAHQTALFAFCAIAQNHGFKKAWDWAATGKMPEPLLAGNTLAVPELKWLHHIPNGGSRGDDAKARSIRGGQLKAQGVRAGVADICLPCRPRIAPASGLYIELKRPPLKPANPASKGGVTDDQRAFGAFVRSHGFLWVVCYGWRDAAECIEQYLSF